MKKIDLPKMESINGHAQSKLFYAACGVLAATVDFSIVNPVWAAFHISAVAGCALVGGIEATF